MIRNLFCVCLVVALSSSMEAQPSNHFDGNTWWEYVKVLADDNMEGRETGSAGLQRAESYVVGELKKYGLQPAGADGYYQPIRFAVHQIDETNSSLALLHDGKTETLTLGKEAILSSSGNVAPEAEAPLVFIGYGLSVPEKNYDDFKGLDLKGKVAVIFSSAPEEIPGPLAAHYRTTAERWKALRAAGVIGIISIPNPAAMDIPWSRVSLNRTHRTMSLVGAEFDETVGTKFSAIFNPEYAEMLFAGSGHSFAEIAALGKERKPLPRFPLQVSVRAKASILKQEVESSNIVAKLEGSDPALDKDYVVLSAHIDHLGIGEPINGDAIYNGAMDNGSGSAMLLDLARSLKQSPEKLRRSVLFVWVVGEEKGLLGSKYFATHPTVDPKAMVADLNTDMFMPIIPLRVLRVQGLAESDLGDRAREVAAAHGVGVQSDPEPQRNLFVRSDQYSFIRHGVPSLAMSVGYEAGSPEQKMFKDWLTQRYHAPSDDLNQPVDLACAAKYEEIMRGLLVSVANDEHRPQWKTDSFFRRYAEAH